MIKAVFITNIPSPYRVDFFAYLQKHYPEYEFHIIFSGAGMENRKWSVELAELSHYHFLKSKTLIIRKRFDDRYVFLPVGVETVSYTHLDVYKRQVPQCAQRCLAATSTNL